MHIGRKARETEYRRGDWKRTSLESGGMKLSIGTGDKVSVKDLVISCFRTILKISYEEIKLKQHHRICFLMFGGNVDVLDINVHCSWPLAYYIHILVFGRGSSTVQSLAQLGPRSK